MYRHSHRSLASKPQGVLVIPSSYFTTDRTVGGGERYALEYAKALSRLTPTTLGLFGPEPATEQVGELTIRTFEMSRSKQQALLYPLCLRTLRNLKGYDLFHVMVFPTPLTDLLLLLSRLWGRKVVLTDVGGGIPCLSTYLKRVWKKADLTRMAHGLALLSNYAARFFHDWSQPKTVLYGGVNTDMFSPGEQGPEGYALYVGRLLPHKGVLPLIQALDAKTPLHVVGRPYDQEYVNSLKQAAVGKPIRFIFDANDTELLREYRGANVVLQPSLPSCDKSELLGMVALEAMGCGKPVIVTDTTSLPELVIDGVTGHVVPAGQPGPLRHAVEKFVANPALSLAWGAAARQHVIRQFGWTEAARRRLALYETLGVRH